MSIQKNKIRLAALEAEEKTHDEKMKSELAKFKADIARQEQ